MSITLGSFTLPDGLRWTDEFEWNPEQTTVNFTLTGAMIVQTATKQAGRPITLTGGLNFTWLTRADLLTLQTLLNTCPDNGLLLTLHDARSFTVRPQQDVLNAIQVPVVMDVGVANPSTTTMYAINTLKFTVIA